MKKNTPKAVTKAEREATPFERQMIEHLGRHLDAINNGEQIEAHNKAFKEKVYEIRYYEIRGDFGWGETGIGFLGGKIIAYLYSEKMAVQFDELSIGQSAEWVSNMSYADKWFDRCAQEGPAFGRWMRQLQGETE